MNIYGASDCANLAGSYAGAQSAVGRHRDCASVPVRVRVCVGVCVCVKLCFQGIPFCRGTQHVSGTVSNEATSGMGRED